MKKTFEFFCYKIYFWTTLKNSFYEKILHQRLIINLTSYDYFLYLNNCRLHAATFTHKFVARMIKLNLRGFLGTWLTSESYSQLIPWDWVLTGRPGKIAFHSSSVSFVTASSSSVVWTFARAWIAHWSRCHRSGSSRWTRSTKSCWS